MKKYYIDLKHGDTRNAGSKAVNDCNKILNELGYKPFEIDLNSQYTGINKVVKRIASYSKFNHLPHDGIIVIPHPIFTVKDYFKDLKKNKKKNNNKYIFLIHDLESLRNDFTSGELSYDDKMMVNLADYIISHNKYMTDYLIEKGVEKEKIIDLELFDYLVNRPDEEKRFFSKNINIAGNLDKKKSEYIYKLSEVTKYKINLFGVNYDESNSGDLVYHGSYPADEIPFKLKDGFGLVWDGNDINSCSGITGEYLRYNNPHKLSLYIAAGLPVIIWAQAAEADFVRENNLGICVDSLSDLDKFLDEIDEKKYYNMLNNIEKVKTKVQDGYFLKRAIKKINIED